MAKDGGTLTLCLVDREIPPPDLVDCNKFQPRELVD
jgi:hypothetical protein